MPATRWKPAVTVAAVIEHEGRFLLVEELTPEGLRWNQPAGHLEPRESLLAAVCREVLEETAHEFQPTGFLGSYLAPGPQETFLRFALVGTVGLALDRPLDAPIQRAFWADLATLQAHPERMRSPLVMRCINDYLQVQQHGTPLLPLSALAYLPD